MARGWESKEVESQMLEAEAAADHGGEKRLSPQERARILRHNTLVLSRTRVQGELGRCANARFRAQLESELNYLEAEIRKLED